MFVGHAALAFAIVGSVAVARGWSTRTALSAALLAGAFATVPDVDMVYALVGIAGAAGGDALAIAGAFWSTGNVVHRAVTHSLVIAPPVALLAALQVSPTRRRQLLSLGLGAALVTVITVDGGALATLVTGLFLVAAVAVATVADRYTDLTAPQVFGAALLGLVSHPFGDLFTGEPPAMLYPLDSALVTERVALATDPTLHLLGAFGIELATVWAAVCVACLATGLRPTTAVSPRATLGAGYAASILLIPAPTLELSYPFVFSVLGVGLVGALPRVRLVARTIESPDWLGAGLTGLSTITVAWAAYAVAYVVIS